MPRWYRHWMGRLLLVGLAIYWSYRMVNDTGKLWLGVVTFVVVTLVSISLHETFGKEDRLGKKY